MTSGFKNEDVKLDKLFSVKDLTAVVTGGGTGIGEVLPESPLASNGAKVYITGRRKEALDKVVDLYSGPGKIIAVPGDITDKTAVQQIASQLGQQEPNGIHLLVNNAGIARDDETKFSAVGEPDFTSAQSISDHFMKSDPENWQETFQTNLTAQFFTTMAFLPLLGKARDATPKYSPSVVNITSISGVMKGSSGGQFAYATSKAGFIHMTRMLANTLAKAKIRVNSIAPGLFPSEMTTGESGDDQKSQIDKKLTNPAGRPGSDQDMAACILFLAGPGGLFLNGQVIYPDGGNITVQPAAT
ncbi:putative short chain dehydrogenase reductase [Phaeomoniella chlamydospora]|uniref:Putative short chain dehydrogenase reductase n=1 Tax=Phaeomoniella chlamydospora TaxID=158046 RepID=A0A0G2EWK1_PHACM|nr:putative short chain dehydrogenase reductase [Phaeomoniella chlamydospora]